LDPKQQKHDKFSFLEAIFNPQLLWMGFWTILNPCDMHASSGRAARKVCQMPSIMSLEHLTPKTK
jgi:hypothetical protein